MLISFPIKVILTPANLRAFLNSLCFFLCSHQLTSDFQQFSLVLVLSNHIFDKLILIYIETPLDK
jgi:hypothetical protein